MEKPKMDPSSPQWKKEKYLAVNRFASVLSGTFRSLLIYRKDNTVYDEILGNLVKRFEEAATFEPKIKLGITNQTLLFDKKPVGFPEVTIFLASALRSLGMKEIIFTAPLHPFNFGPIFKILSNKDSTEAKMDKLTPFLGDGEDRPIALVPVSANSIALRLSDDMIKSRLAPMALKKSDGGTGFIEALEESGVAHLPDLYTWIQTKSEMFPDSLKAFVQSLTDATREGYFPVSRYLLNLPIPNTLRNRITDALEIPLIERPRRATSLGQKFIPAERGSGNLGRDLSTYLTSFSMDEIRTRQDIRTTGGKVSFQKDIELAQALLNESGHDFAMGLRLLIRILGEKNIVANQEKALKIGILVWSRSQSLRDDAHIISLLSSLRHNLSLIHNLTLILYPMKNASMESEQFKKLGQIILSLGEAALPSLIETLDAETERGMRRKLCHLVTLITSECGISFLQESLTNASTFLTRNILMILGDVKNPEAIETLQSFVGHSSPIVRVEAIRSLVKIGNEEVMKLFFKLWNQISDGESQKIIAGYFERKKDRNTTDVLIQFLNKSNVTVDGKRGIYQALSAIGGARARQFLESQQNTSLFGQFSSEERETQALLKSLIQRTGR